MGVPHGVYDQSGLSEWYADFDANGNVLYENNNPRGTGAFFQPFMLPGQFALSANAGGPTASAGGLYDNWHRVYDSVTGRYLAPDRFVLHQDGQMPVRNEAGVPGGVNLAYGYATESPLRWQDHDASSALPIWIPPPGAEFLPEAPVCSPWVLLPVLGEWLGYGAGRIYAHYCPPGARPYHPPASAPSGAACSIDNPNGDPDRKAEPTRPPPGGGCVAVCSAGGTFQEYIEKLPARNATECSEQVKQFEEELNANPITAPAQCKAEWYPFVF